MTSIQLAGIDIDNVTMPEALDLLEQFIASGRPHLIVTPNPEMIVNAQSDPEFKKIINTADLRLPDGISLVVVSRILNVFRRDKATPCLLKERVSGIDFMLKALELSSKKGYRIFLLGSAPGVANEAVKKLLQQFPGLNIVGAHHGYFSDVETQNIASQINRSKPDILFAGLGHDRQEKWLSAHLLAPACIGIGGSLDVLSGRVKRAPKIVQMLYIEWLYRLVTQPWRWKRQIALIKFLWLVLRPKIFYNR